MLVLVAAGLFYFAQEEPPPRPTAPAPKTAASTATTPAPKAGVAPTQPAGPTTELGQAVAKAKSITANAAAAQAAAMDEVLGGDNPKSVPAASAATATPGDSAGKSAAVPANLPTVDSASSSGSATTTTPEASPAVAKSAPPPPPSVAFKAWVQNLRISGVRGGANPRVFIERTAYAPGDLVNPQLGILFETYNAETRMIVFKDKSGALVERRN